VHPVIAPEAYDGVIFPTALFQGVHDNTHARVDVRDARVIRREHLALLGIVEPPVIGRIEA
jgi:hypothetical protein